MSKYLNIDDAAAYLGVSKRWIYGHVNLLPHRKFGGFLKFTADELDKWADSQRWVTA